MIKIKILQFFIVWAVMFIASGVTQAVPVLDQFFDSSELTSMASDVGSTDKAQTFTVGITGTLVRADVEIMRWPPSTIGGVPIPTGDLLFDIRTTIGGVPIDDDTMTLASMVVSADSIPMTRGWYSFDIKPFDVSVTTGDILAIVLRSESDNMIDYRWFGGLDRFDDTYDFGAHYYRNPSYGITTWTLLSGGDVGFKTFVEPIPEPSTLLLLGSGLIGIMGFRIRKTFKKI